MSVITLLKLLGEVCTMLFPSENLTGFPTCLGKVQSKDVVKTNEEMGDQMLSVLGKSCVIV